MNFHFSKMQGLGNDFVVIECITQSVSITYDLIQKISDRHYGIGCDQVLLLTESKNPAADFGYRIFNSDGTEVFQCGNGVRCMGLFVRDKKFKCEKMVTFETERGLLRAECVSKNEVIVDIALPNFDPARLPFITTEKKSPFHIDVLQKIIECDIVDVGNPHCVIHNKNYSEQEMMAMGDALNHHTQFSEGVNVGFVKILSRDEIQLRVFERGAGMTQACGSGACAAVAIGCKNNELSRNVLVHQPGGALRVLWPSDHQMIRLQGLAHFVFEGHCSF